MYTCIYTHTCVHRDTYIHTHYILAYSCMQRYVYIFTMNVYMYCVKMYIHKYAFGHIDVCIMYAFRHIDVCIYFTEVDVGIYFTEVDVCIRTHRCMHSNRSRRKIYFTSYNIDIHIYSCVYIYLGFSRSSPSLLILCALPTSCSFSPSSECWVAHVPPTLIPLLQLLPLFALLATTCLARVAPNMLQPQLLPLLFCLSRSAPTFACTMDKVKVLD